MKADSSNGAASLLSACLSLIANKGIVGVTHRSVAEASNTSNGLSTHHFGSIAGLIRETMLRVGAKHVRDQSEYFERANRARSVNTLVDLLARNSERLLLTEREMGLAAVELQLAAARDETLRPILLDQSRHYVRQLERVLDRFGSQSPKSDAVELTALISGLILSQLALPRTDFLDKILRPAIRRFLKNRLAE